MKNIIFTIFLVTLASVTNITYANDIFNSAKGLVKENLKDPYSAKFRKMFITHGEGHTFVCGEVNAKNSFGAYVGHRKFIVNMNDKEASTQPTDGDVEKVLFQAMWQVLCIDLRGDKT